MRVKEIKMKQGKGTVAFPVHFGFACQAEFCEEMQITLAEFDERVGGSKLRLMDIITLAWYAIKHGCRRTASPFTLTKEELADLLDDNPTAITKLFELLVEAQPKAEEGAASEGGEGNGQG